MYKEEPNLLADRSINPKLSDIYNLFDKCRKSSLSISSGKRLFTCELERRVNVYNDAYGEVGGKAIIQRYCKTKSKNPNNDEGMDQPLILAICTPLMSRVHHYILQSKELQGRIARSFGVVRPRNVCGSPIIMCLWYLATF